MTIEKLHFFAEMIRGELAQIPDAGMSIDKARILKLRKLGKRVKAYTGMFLDQVNQVEETKQPAASGKEKKE